MKNKIVSAAEAIAIIRDGDTIAWSDFIEPLHVIADNHAQQCAGLRPAVTTQ